MGEAADRGRKAPAAPAALAIEGEESEIVGEPVYMRDGRRIKPEELAVSRGLQRLRNRLRW
jgi:hypothetical protein